MKALKVFCIIFTVVAMAITGLFVIMNRTLLSEQGTVRADHKSAMSTVQCVDGEYSYTVTLAEDNKKTYSETEFLSYLKNAEGLTANAATATGVFGVLCLAGAIASGVVVKRRKNALAAA